MEKLADTKKTVFTQLIEDFPKNAAYEQFKVYPQMPMDQIQHYIRLGARKKNSIIIQFNPSSFSNEFSEVAGCIRLSPKSSQIILTPRDEQTIHLIQPQFIRHIRLAHLIK